MEISVGLNATISQKHRSRDVKGTSRGILRSREMGAMAEADDSRIATDIVPSISTGQQLSSMGVLVVC